MSLLEQIVEVADLWERGFNNEQAKNAQSAPPVRLKIFTGGGRPWCLKKLFLLHYTKRKSLHQTEVYWHSFSALNWWKWRINERWTEWRIIEWTKHFGFGVYKKLCSHTKGISKILGLCVLENIWYINRGPFLSHSTEKYRRGDLFVLKIFWPLKIFGISKRASSFSSDNLVS